MSEYAFVIEPGEHAELSASSAERWLTCPGSVELSRGLPNTSSAYAAQGTAAHYIAAHEQFGGPQSKNPDAWNAARWLGKTALVEGHEIALDDDLIEAVQEFLDHIRETEKPGDVASVEQSFTPAMKKLHPKFGGSTDRVMWRESARLLRIYDYKHGAGVAVDVDDNKQLKYYALGALLTNKQWNAEDVELVIAQPRCDHEQGRFRPYRFKAIELLEFAADLIDGAKRTEEFGADLVPSKKACKWCPAAAANKCPAVEKHTHALVAADFTATSIERYSKDQIAEFLRMAPLVESRISAVREFAYNRACAGEEFPGFKIVAKRPTRKWTDEVAARLSFEKTPGALKEPELRSPAQIEKLLGKKKFAPIAETLVEKKSSGYTLAPAEDPRPPAQVAQLEDFSVVSENAEKKEQ
jgi:Protein of unknown function (DUF2800)